MNGETKIYKNKNNITITYTDNSFGYFGMASASISNSIDILGNGSWFFNRLFVNENMRNHGVASVLMDELIKILDEEKIILVNQVNPYGDLDYDQLVSFYKKYDFVDMDVEGGLVRHPKSR